MKNICRTALLGATMAFATMLSTANAQKAGQFNPTGQALTSDYAYEQYKLQYMSEHPELFKQAESSQKQASGKTEEDNAKYEAAKVQATAADEHRAKLMHNSGLVNIDRATLSDLDKVKYDHKIAEIDAKVSTK